MKAYLLGIFLVVLSTFMMVFQFQYNNHQREFHHLKFVAEEAAAAAAQFYHFDETLPGARDGFADGYITFNQTEAIKATEYLLKTQLRLDDNFIPLDHSYWSDPIDYTIEFFDDSNTELDSGFLYTHVNGLYQFTITQPTVVVTVNAGSARYSSFSSDDNTRIALHEWQERF